MTHCFFIDDSFNASAALHYSILFFSFASFVHPSVHWTLHPVVLSMGAARTDTRGYAQIRTDTDGHTRIHIYPIVSAVAGRVHAFSPDTNGCKRIQRTHTDTNGCMCIRVHPSASVCICADDRGSRAAIAPVEERSKGDPLQPQVPPLPPRPPRPRC